MSEIKESIKWVYARWPHGHAYKCTGQTSNKVVNKVVVTLKD